MLPSVDRTADLRSMDVIPEIFDAFGTLLATSPRTLRVIGMTATPFRLDSGMLHVGKDAIFSDICHETPVMDLVDAGYLAPLRAKSGSVAADLSRVHETLCRLPATVAAALRRLGHTFVPSRKALKRSASCLCPFQVRLRPESRHGTR